MPWLGSNSNCSTHFFNLYHNINSTKTSRCSQPCIQVTTVTALEQLHFKPCKLLSLDFDHHKHLSPCQCFLLFLIDLLQQTAESSATISSGNASSFRYIPKKSKSPTVNQKVINCKTSAPAWSTLLWIRENNEFRDRWIWQPTASLTDWFTNAPWVAFQ